MNVSSNVSSSDGWATAAFGAVQQFGTDTLLSIWKEVCAAVCFVFAAVFRAKLTQLATALQSWLESWCRDSRNYALLRPNVFRHDGGTLDTNQLLALLHDAVKDPAARFVGEQSLVAKEGELDFRCHTDANLTHAAWFKKIDEILDRREFRNSKLVLYGCAPMSVFMYIGQRTDQTVVVVNPRDEHPVPYVIPRGQSWVSPVAPPAVSIESRLALSNPAPPADEKGAPVARTGFLYVNLNRTLPVRADAFQGLSAAAIAAGEPGALQRFTIEPTADEKGRIDFKPDNVGEIGNLLDQERKHITDSNVSSVILSTTGPDSLAVMVGRKIYKGIRRIGLADFRGAAYVVWFLPARN